MSGTDYRALCAELLDEVAARPLILDRELIARARAALAAEADGPAVPEGREPAAVIGEPSDEELLDLAAAEMNNAPNWEEPEYSYKSGRAFPYEAPGVAWVNFARAVLARYGHQPTPPAEEEVAELVVRLRRASDGASAMGWEQDSWVIARAAELLEQRHPEPVPVALSERLPEPEDCDAEGRCWLYRPQTPILNPYWDLVRLDYIDPVPPTYWLPAHALPLPAGEVQS